MFDGKRINQLVRMLSFVQIIVPSHRSLWCQQCAGSDLVYEHTRILARARIIFTHNVGARR
eukprot:scaffold139706_cov42-Attheya_sp.AAC.3